MNQDITASLPADISRAPSGTSREFYPPKKSYTPEDKRGVLGRHTVTPQKLSVGQLASVGALGGFFGASLGVVAKSVTDCSWTTIAATSAIGATVFVSHAVASNRPITPLEHAEAELMQTQDDKACLLNRDIDNPHRNYDASELYTIQRLSERYGVSWQLFKILWEVAESSGWKPDLKDSENAMAMINSRLKELNVPQLEIDNIVPQMKCYGFVEDARQLSTFQKLINRIDIPERNHDEIGLLMFAYSRLLSDEHNPDGEQLQDLYQTVCQEMYEFFMVRIAMDESRVLNDIRILQAMSEEDKH
ncbi:hypothetical protein [Endozoicomonas sp. ONNA2]|uniref:hypothetical protein n=1 Tax=Endozoicomonas sp. ONNA2 TaxID=2828741 RepID=UPI0021498023|nr:hypothetical protein [Endozoicomonas sp. ONNA2]